MANKMTFGMAVLWLCSLPALGQELPEVGARPVLQTPAAARERRREGRYQDVRRQGDVQQELLAEDGV